MQGGKNWVLPKDTVLMQTGLSLAGNMVKQLMSLYGTEWRERGYGLSISRQLAKIEAKTKFHSWKD